MWLVVSWWAAISATTAYICSKNPKAYRLDWLCLMLWGLAVMVLVDHVLSFVIESREFIETSVDGVLVGFIMLIPIFLIWEVSALILKKREMPTSESLGRR